MNLMNLIYLNLFVELQACKNMTISKDRNKSKKTRSAKPTKIKHFPSKLN
jgi:hypothetical protein